MGKLKTHKGVAKRFKKTKSGKLKYSSCGLGHLLTNKTSKRKRSLRKAGILSKPSRQLKQLMPYS